MTTTDALRKDRRPFVELVGACIVLLSGLLGLTDCSTTREPSAAGKPPEPATEPRDAEVASDAASRATDGSVATVLPLPSREPGTGIAAGVCNGRLAPWTLPERVFSVVVTRGRDGFMALRSDQSDPASSSSGDIFIYDAQATPLAAIGHVALQTELWLSDSAAAGGTTAALATCSYKGVGCGSTLAIDRRQPVQFPGLFVAPPQMAIGPDGSILFGTQRTTEQTPQYYLQRRNASGALRKEAPLGPAYSRALGLAVDSRGRAIALVDESADPSLVDTQRVVVRLDADLTEEARFATPSGWTIDALAVDASDRVVLVGSLEGADASAPELVLAALGSDFTPVWQSVAEAPGAPLAVSITPSGDVLVAGGTDAAKVWFERYDGAGKPRGEGPLVSDQALTNALGASSVREQSDGTIFLSTGTEAFVYCPAAGATTPDALAAENCRKFPPCDTLSCPSNQVPMQLAVCPPANVAVCECIPRPVGQ